MLSVGRFLLLLLLSVLFRIIPLVHAAPTLSFPINSQVPPVARIGEYFSFIFSAATFSSPSGSPLTYSLYNPPSWLSLDTVNRVLSGTPQDDDVAPGTVVGVPVVLVATDSTGSTFANVTLVVSRSPAPTINVPLSEQIRGFGNYSEPASILFYPEKDFKFTFAQDSFFDPDAPVLNYYAVMSDNSPLPAWISFDQDNISFTGVTPPFGSLIEPPQTFSIKLVASDITGFSAVSIGFSIVVGIHTLATDEPKVTLNATVGTLLTYDELAGSIRLDGHPASPVNVNATPDDIPDWLLFDEVSWNISGTPPADAPNSTIFTVTFVDSYSDVLNITFDVKVSENTSMFSSPFPALTVEPGKHLSFDLKSYLLDSSDVDVTADIQPTTSWLSWDSSLLTLSGDVPTLATKSDITVTFVVSAKGSNTKAKRAAAIDTQVLTIHIEPVTTTTTSTDTTSSRHVSSTSSTAKPSKTSTTSNSSDKAPSHRSPNVTIIAAVISAVAAFAITVCIAFYCCSRNKKRRLSRSSLGDMDVPPSGTDNYIHTPGISIGSPDVETHTEKIPPSEKFGTKMRKSSNLRSELSRPSTPLPAIPSVAVTAYDEQSPDPTPVGKLKDWFTSVRNMRFANLRHNHTRFSSSFLSDDDASHRELDLDIGLGIARSGLLTRRSASQVSFRSDVEVGVPTIMTTIPGGSIHRTPEIAYVGEPSRKGKKRAVTPLVPRTFGGTPEVSRSQPHYSDPFTDTPSIRLVEEAITPNSDPGPSSSERPPYPRPTSFHIRQHPALRPTHSPKSSTSISSVDSMRSRTRKFARKATSHAKGAVSLASMALQQPKRKTLAALRRNPHLSLRNSKRSHRGVVESVDANDGDQNREEDEVSMTATAPTPAVPAAAATTTATTTTAPRRGFGGFLSPRIWASGGNSRAPSPVPTVAPSVVPEEEASGAAAGGNTAIHTTPTHHRRRDSRLGSSHSIRRVTPNLMLRSSSRGSTWSQRRRGLDGGTSGGGGGGGGSFRRASYAPIRRRPVGATERMSHSSYHPNDTDMGGSLSVRNSQQLQQPPYNHHLSGAFSSTRSSQQHYYNSRHHSHAFSQLSDLPSPLSRASSSLPGHLAQDRALSGAYEDLISSSPFHPSRSRSSWTTISGGDSISTGAPTVVSVGKGNKKDSSQSMTMPSPNWVVFDTGGGGGGVGVGIGGGGTRMGSTDTGRSNNNRESPVIRDRDSTEWRRFGPAATVPIPPSRSDSFLVTGEEEEERDDEEGEGYDDEPSPLTSVRNLARNSLFLAGGCFGGGAAGGGGAGGGLRVVNRGEESYGSSVDVGLLEVDPLLAGSREVSPREVSPREVSPREISPREVDPLHVSPHNLSPHNVSPHNVSPHNISPHNISPHNVSPHNVSPHNVSPHNLSPHNLSPHNVSPHNLSSHNLIPHNLSSHNLGPHNVSPHNVSPHNLSPHNLSPHNLSPHNRSPHNVSPHNLSSHNLSPHNVSPHNLSPHNLSPHNVSPHNLSPHNLSPHNRSPHNLSTRNLSLDDIDPLDVSHLEVDPREVDPLDVRTTRRSSTLSDSSRVFL